MPIRAERTVDLVAANLRRDILRGRWPATTALPAERALAVELGVSRPTLRAAIARLQTEGLLAPMQGTGVRVLDYRRHANLEILRHLVEMDPELIRAVLELRRVLGAEAVALACQRATVAERSRLRKLSEAQQVERDPHQFLERDLEFARALLEAAHNPAMLLLFNSVESFYRAHPELSEAMLADLDAARGPYRAVVSIIDMRAATDTRAHVRSLLESADQQTLRRIARARRRRSS